MNPFVGLTRFPLPQNTVGAVHERYLSSGERRGLADLW